ncbi:MAG: flagellar biosynthesis protein FlhF [Candidatus Dactylopiibacterium carminicum]|nr:MAG: flagellar biosynthesis protein FlhF [Candidatus Dactylopiibacterium carminicum]
MVQVRRYVGKTAREALAALKAELGPDAVVLSNRAVAAGVEIVAMPADQMSDLNATVREASAPRAAPAAQRAPAPAPASVPAPSDDEHDFTVTLGQHIARLAREQESTPALTSRRSRHVFESTLSAHPLHEGEGSQMNVRAFNPPRVLPNGEPEPPRRQSLAKSVEAPVEATPRVGEDEVRVRTLEATNARLMDELGSIRGMLERQLAGFAWNEIARTAPTRTQMMGELLEAGFSAQLARDLSESVPVECSVPQARGEVRGKLNRVLNLIDSDADIVDRGGVYALVGPTGVGKTTTAAKLAARCVVRHGADKLALVTTDGYRIGAHEQLRIYGRILGVAVHVVRDASDLRQTLQDLRRKHMVLTDTMGMSQRDKMVADQASMLAAAGAVRRLLVLNATSRGDTLESVVQAYEGGDLAGCILSKIDEAASLGPALDIAIRRELQVFYVTNGQRVPEDLHLPNRNYLIHRALREQSTDSAFKLDASEASLLMASQAAGENMRKGA